MAFSLVRYFLADRYHTVRWIGSVELLDQQAAMLEHRALVDRALVGDLALVDRERRVHEDRARDPRRGSRGRAEKAGQPFAKCLAHQPVAGRDDEIVGGSVGVISRQPSRSSTTSAETSSRLMPAMTMSRTSGAQAATKRARNGPTLTQVPLPSLKSSPMRPSKSKPALRSSGSTGLSASPSL